MKKNANERERKKEKGKYKREQIKRRVLTSSMENMHIFDNEEFVTLLSDFSKNPKGILRSP